MPAQPVSATPALRHRIAWGWCAVVLSLALHALLLSRMPGWWAGALRETPLFPDYPAIALDRVERTLRPRPAVAERFRAEDPGQLRELWADVPVPDEPLDVPVPELPDASSGPVQGEAEALAEPRPEAMPTAAWDPRQEILQIEQPQLDDRAEARPRRWAAVTPRADRVPDIVLPVESPTGFLVASRADLPPGIESLSRSALPPPAQGGEPASAPPVSALAGGELPVKPPLLEEVPWTPEARVLEPVEQQLQMLVRRYTPPDEPEAVYLEIQVKRNRDNDLPVLPKDVLFVQDCSESMTPWKLAECKRGLVRWLDQLNPGDRFDVMAFRDTTARCFGEWRPFTLENKAQALSFIDALRAQGNTDVYASLQAALAVPREPGRPVLMALITDGHPTAGETAGSAIIEGFTSANRGRISVFGLGGGQRVNRFLLDLLSYRNRGDVLVEESIDRIPMAMERWGAETRRPVLSDLSYRFAGAEEAVVYPVTLTHLYLDRPLVLYARLPAQAGPSAFQIIGQSGAKPYDMVFPLDWREAEPGDADIRTRWVWHRIYEWIGGYLRSPGEADRVRIQALADRHGLAVPYGFGTAVPRW